MASGFSLDTRVCLKVGCPKTGLERAKVLGIDHGSHFTVGFDRRGFSISMGGCERWTFNRDIEVNGVYGAVSLELHPDAVDMGTRKREIELNVWTRLHRQRMGMHHVDEILTCRKHVPPSPKILLNSI